MDAIRGFAALVVFLAHGRNMFFGNVQGPVPAEALSAAAGPASTAVSNSAVVPAALGIGHHAVIVFFVLSGYLVGGSAVRGIREGRWSWRVYLTQRLTRLWMVLIPALLIGLCLDASGSRLFGPGSLYGAPAGQSVIQHSVVERLDAWTLVKNATFVQTILGPELGSNVALWSLANEFWYYIAFPLLALMIWPRSGGFSRPALARVVLLLATAGVLGFVGPSIAVYFSIWLLGAAIPYVPRGTKNAGKLTALLAAGSLVSASAYIRKHPFASQYTSDLVLALICCVLLWGCLHETRPARRTLYTRAAQRLSGMSYTLYLVHLPALVFCSALIEGDWRRWPKDPNHMLAFAAISAAVLLYASGLFLLFERNTDHVRAAISRRGRQPADASLEAAA